jgi:hypothetical protein
MPSYIGEEPPLEQTLEIDLEMGEFKFIKEPTVIGTGASNPCLGLIIYDPVNKCAFAAHLYGGMGNPELNSNYDIIRRGIENFSNCGTLVAYLCGLGGNPSHLSQEPTTKLVISCGLADDRIYARWAKNNSHYQSIMLDIRTGEVNYLEVSDFEFENY